MIKSPLRYPGGKSRAVELISKLLPEFDEYREPFLGGGSIFIYAKQRFPNKKFWVNDLYLELYKFWEMTQKDVDALIEKIYEWRNQFPIGKELYKFLNANLDSFNDLERAAAFFIYNRITFSGTSLSGGFSEHAFSGRFTESSIQRLKQFAKVINGSTITNLDYEELVKEKGENVFILFGGSGSELITCKNLKRNYISCELHQDYFKMIIDRLNNNGKINDEFRLDFINQKKSHTLQMEFNLFSGQYEAQRHNKG